MKLKKIASLALAGVMAVSMLTACGEGANSGNGGEGSGDSNGSATGYSSVFANVVSDAVKDKDYITFQDNATDAAALEDALGNRGSLVTIVNTVTPAVLPVSENSAVGQDFVAALKLNDYGYDSWKFSANYMVNDTRKVGDIFVVDGTVDMTKVMKQIADNYYNDKLEELDEKSNIDNESYDFHYTVSVSVMNKAVDTIDWYHGSANFIAVTVTRTATAD